MVSKKFSLILLCLLGALPGALISPRHAFAWKPNTHAYLADQARIDAVDDGKVTISQVDYRSGQILRVLGEYEVEQSTLDAIRQFPAQYRAGVVGPDAYPDILTGQQAIHPNKEDVGGTVTNDWLEYIWQKSETAPYNTLPVRAFVVGYLTHAAGDMYGHTFVNKFSHGEFELGENAVKHIVLESYVGKRTPSLSSYDIRIDGVREFIYREMVDARPGESLYETLLRGDGSKYSVPRIYSELRAELQRDIDDYDNTINNFNRRIDEKKRAARACRPLDFSCSAVALRAQAVALETEKQGFIAAQGWRRSYKVAWRNDIDDGLRELPVFSHELAKAMTLNPGGVDRDRVNALVGDYVEDHLISMSGAPDLSIDFLSVVEDMFSAIPFIEQQINRMKRDFLNYLLEEATGLTLQEIEGYISSPERYFDEVMGRGAGQHTNLETFNRDVLKITEPGFNQNNPETFNYQDFPAAYNTVTMSKLALMKPSEINRLLNDLNSRERLVEDNVMLGFMKTLDGDNQWLQGMEFAKDCDTYRQIFLQQIGETPCEGSMPEQNWGAGAREAFRYCIGNGFASGFPDGEEGIENGQRVIGVNCLNGSSRFSIPSDISVWENWGAGAREAFRYCIGNGFASGFPDGEEGIENGQRVIGVNCLNGSSRFSIPSDISVWENWGAGAREAFRYCIGNGFASGFPDGEEGIENGQRVIGVNCLNGSSRFSIPSDISLF